MVGYDDRRSYSIGQPDTLRPCLQFHLLGPPTIAWNGVPLEIQRRSVRALLYRLACATEPLTRCHLLSLFWPEAPETIARRNLSHHLTHLRRALPEQQIVETAGDRVWLVPDRVWCDVAALKHAAVDAPAGIALLRYLADLYRGPFLEDFDLPACAEFEHWCVAERHTLERCHMQLLERLVIACLTHGEAGLASEYAQRYLQIDPLSEAMHRRLIQLYAAAGDRHLALRQFKRCEADLQRELGVSPLPETRAIYESVLQSKSRFPKPPPAMRPSLLLGAEVPFIGREEEMERLEAVFSQWLARPGQVVLISGEAGIGKSRLMREFVKRHTRVARQTGGVNVLYGQSHAGEQTIPYQPLLPILRAMLDLPEPGSSPAGGGKAAGRSPPDYIDPVWLSEIARLLPEMPLVYPELPPPLPVEPESARSRLFDALCQLILAYATAHGPIVICLDDLQWADATTGAWLVHIGCRLAHSAFPILLLGTYRSEEAEALLDLRHNLAREGILLELKLAGLQEGAVLELLRRLVGRKTGDETVAARLHQATGGNPFYLIEIVHQLIEENGLASSFPDSDQLRLPESVREALQARLQRLSPVARQLLEAAAVLGSSFDVELLRLTAGRSHGETLAGLEELIARLLLVELRDEYGFIHEIIRQHVDESLGQARRQLLHRRAGRVYQRFKPDKYPLLAYHFESGGDLPRALHYHDLAAGQAQALFAWRIAEYHQGQMLVLLARLDPDTRQPALVRRRAAILADRAQARYLQDSQVERDADLATLSDLGETSADDRVRLQAIFNRLKYLNADGNYTQAMAAAESGLALIGACPNLFENKRKRRLARSRLLAHLGYAFFFLGRPLEALGVLDKACRSCQGHHDPEACGRVQHVLGYVYLHLGDYTQALVCQQRALDFHTQAGDSIHLAWDLIDIGALHMKMGDVTRARDFLEEGLALATRVGSQQARAHGLVHQGSLALYRGNYAAAPDYYRQALALQQATRSEHIIAAAEAGLGLALYHLGDYIQSRHWLERARQRARATSHAWQAAEVLIRLGLLDMAEGRLALACQHLDEGLAQARACQAGESLVAGLAAMARLARLSQDPAAALESAAEAVRVARRINLGDNAMWGEIETGLAYLALGRTALACNHTQLAANHAPLAGQEWVGHEEAYRAHAQTLQTLGHNDDARFYEQRARLTIQAKAALIAGTTLRCQFLSRFGEGQSNLAS